MNIIFNMYYDSEMDEKKRIIDEPMFVLDGCCMEVAFCA